MGDAAIPLSGSRLSGMPLRLLGDEGLTRRAAKGDRRAFAEIFERYHQAIYRYCLSIVRQEEDARDALQNTMAAAMRSLPGEKREVALKPWLYRVAHNEAISLLRRRRDQADLEQAPDLAAAGADVSADRAEQLRQLVADLQELPERQRGALVMRELGGLAYGEIGASFSVSEGAARQAVYEARVMLQEIAEGRELDCEGVRRTISERDGRMLRARKLRAHLRHCEGCRDFREALGDRRRDLQSLAPPLAPAAAAGLLAALLGGGGGGGGGTGGLLAALGVSLGKGAGASSAAKGAAAAAAAASLGVGTVAVVEKDVPLTGPDRPAKSGPARAGETAPGASDRSDHAAAGIDPVATGSATRPEARESERRRDRSRPERRARRPSDGRAADNSASDESAATSIPAPAATTPASSPATAPAPTSAPAPSNYTAASTPQARLPSVDRIVTDTMTQAQRLIQQTLTGTQQLVDQFVSPRTQSGTSGTGSLQTDISRMVDQALSGWRRDG